MRRAALSYLWLYSVAASETFLTVMWHVEDLAQEGWGRSDYKRTAASLFRPLLPTIFIPSQQQPPSLLYSTPTFYQNYKHHVSLRNLFRPDSLSICCLCSRCPRWGWGRRTLCAEQDGCGHGYGPERRSLGTLPTPMPLPVHQEQARSYQTMPQAPVQALLSRQALQNSLLSPQGMVVLLELSLPRWQLRWLTIGITHLLTTDHISKPDDKWRSLLEFDTASRPLLISVREVW